VLNTFGFASLGIVEDDFAQLGYVIQLGQPPARINLLTSLTGVEFDDCYQRFVEVEIDNMRIPIIHSEDLIANKKALGRHQDLADLEELENKKPN